MKKKMSMTAIKGSATKKGFVMLLSRTGGSAKQFGCLRCHKNTAVKFVKGNVSVLACPCGWRKKGKN
jgi:hypothetical protein